MRQTQLAQDGDRRPTVPLSPAVFLAMSLLMMLPGVGRSATKKPDLVVSSVSAPSQVARGQKLSITDATKNVGTKQAPGSQTEFYLSKDTAKGGNDTKIGARSVPKLGRGAKSKVTTKAPVPSGDFPLGKYFVIACADAKRKVTELKEGNNCRASGSKVEVKLPSITPVILIDGRSNEDGVTEGRNGVFTVELSKLTSKTVTVELENLGGSATVGEDYTDISQTLTFTPGQFQKELLVPTEVDDLYEDNEFFELEISAPTNATLQPNKTRTGAAIVDRVDSLVNEDIAFQRVGGGQPGIWTNSSRSVPSDVAEHYGDGADPDWGYGADHGHKLFFSSHGGEADRDIYMLNTNTDVVTKVANLSGDEYSPSIDPEATLLAFQSSADLVGTNADGDDEIFVRNMSNGAITQVTNNGVDDVRPDLGPGLVYASGDGSKDIWGTFNVAAPPQQITDTPLIDEANPAIAADGKTIAFDSDEEGSRDIYFLRLNSTISMPTRRVTTGPGDETMPTLSQDGRYVAFADSAEQAIVRMHLPTCTQRTIAAIEGAEDIAPDWKHSFLGFALPVRGSACLSGPELPLPFELALISEDEAAVSNVFSADPDSNEANEPVNTTSSAIPERDPAWSGDGSAIAFVRGDELYRKDTTTGAVTRITDFLEGSFKGLTWHPSEEVIAFGYKGDSTGGASTDDFDIVVHDFSMPDDVFVVSAGADAANDVMPDWSPDGTQLAFVSDKDSAPDFSLYKRAVELTGDPGSEMWAGSNEVRLTHLAFDVATPDWSPDGADIAFASPHPGAAAADTELYVVRVADGLVHRLTNDAADHRDPAWSPAFHALAWATRFESSARYIIQGRLLTGGCATGQPSNTPADAWGPEWRPDDDPFTVPDYRTCMQATAVPGTGP